PVLVTSKRRRATATDVIMAPSTRLALQWSPRETTGGKRFAFLIRVPHGSGSGLAGKSTQSLPVSPEHVGSKSSRYPDIVRLHILTERFSQQPADMACR